MMNEFFIFIFLLSIDILRGEVLTVHMLAQQKKKTQKHSRLQIFYKIDVLKNFTKFAGKHMCWTLIFNKLHKKKALTEVFSCEFCGNFNDTFFIIEYLWWLVLKIESLFSDSMYKSSHLELFCKKSVLRCALA